MEKQKKKIKKMIRYDFCKGCGICVEMCLKHVFERDKFGYPVIAHDDHCVGCHICEMLCPDLAIGFEEEV